MYMYMYIHIHPTVTLRRAAVRPGQACRHRGIIITSSDNANIHIVWYRYMIHTLIELGGYGKSLFDLTKVVATTSLAARYLEKKLADFDCFRAPPLPVSPGSPEVDPTIDQNKRAG